MDFPKALERLHAETSQIKIALEQTSHEIANKKTLIRSYRERAFDLKNPPPFWLLYIYNLKINTAEYYLKQYFARQKYLIDELENLSRFGTQLLGEYNK